MTEFRLTRRPHQGRYLRWAIGVVVSVVAILHPHHAPAQVRGDDPIDPARVLAAIDRAASYLKRQQGARGNWDDPTAYPGGLTALCTLALLNAGLDSTDDTVAQGLDYLRRLETKDTYVVSLQSMVFSLADPKRDLALIQRNADWLVRTQIKEGEDRGGWGYGADRIGGDPSNSQFAVLALYEAKLAGARVDPEVWERVGAYWRSRQNADGSWAYADGAPGTGSMTCAGIGALVATERASSTGDAHVENGLAVCCVEHDEDRSIARGLEWLGRNFSVRRNPATRAVAAEWHYYYLYGLERAGRLTAERFIGQHDWYREGTEHLVRSQDTLTHAWNGGANEGGQLGATAFSLLFLSKGRRPVLIAKARRGPTEAPAGEPDPRDQHRNDAAHLTHAAEHAWELPMTWQGIDPERATVDDLLQAPVLYVSGAQVDDLRPHAAKLRAYLDRGGFLFAEACCETSQASRASFERLVEAVFPEPEYRLRQLRPEHPVWRMEELVRADSPYVGSLWAVEYGCRTCVVLCDRDLSCYWELDNPASSTEYPDPVAERIADARTVGLNVLAYATNREPRGKEQQFVQRLEDFEVDGPGSRGVIEVAKISHTGGCDDAPGALANLLRAAGEGEVRLRVSTDSPLIGPADAALRRYHFAFMHGRRDFQFTRAERRELRTYLENGGTLLVDAICASRPFTDAFRRELSEAFDGRPLEKIAADDPLLTRAYGGFDIRRVQLRDPQPTGDDEPLVARVRERAPQLEGLKLGERWAVIFSPYDLSCALERHEAVECRGYRRDDAARIGLNVLLYSINQ